MALTGPPALGLALLALGAAGLTCPNARAGETRCWIDKGALVVSASFGAIAGDFLVDLATPSSQIHTTAAEAAGLVPGDGPAPGGPQPSAISDLRIAGERLKVVKMRIVDLDARARDFDTNIGGVLGADVFAPFVVEVRPSPCRLRLMPRPRPVAAGAASAAITGAGDSRPLLTGRIIEAAGARDGRLLIDTSHWASQINANVGSGEALGRRVDIAVAGRRVADIQTVPRQPRVTGVGEEDGSIGMAFWSRRRWRLDLQDGWLDWGPVRRTGPRRRR